MSFPQMSRKRAIDDMKVPKGGKCGLLPCVAMFGEFSERAEAIIMGGDRRSELDKAYAILIDSVFCTVERVAKEHQKTPPDVVRFGQSTQCLGLCPPQPLCVCVCVQRTITAWWTSCPA